MRHRLCRNSAKLDSRFWAPEKMEEVEWMERSRKRGVSETRIPTIEILYANQGNFQNLEQKVNPCSYSWSGQITGMEYI